MGTLKQLPEKFSKQKGQGMLEYALIISFIAAMFIIVFPEGLGDSVNSTFDNAAELLGSASEENDLGGSGGGGSSSSSSGSLIGSLLGDSSSDGSSDSTNPAVVEHKIDEIAKKNYKPLNWQQVISDMKNTYGTITRTQDPDRAIKSEYNLFVGVGSMVSGTLEYNYDAQQNVQGWNNLMNQMGGQIKSNNFTTSYVKGNESLDIKREGDKVIMTYSDGNTANKKEFSIYAEANQMHFESKTDSGTTTDPSKTLTEFTSISEKIYSNGWSFKNN